MTGKQAATPAKPSFESVLKMCKQALDHASQWRKDYENEKLQAASWKAKYEKEVVRAERWKQTAERFYIEFSILRDCAIGDTHDHGQ